MGRTEGRPTTGPNEPGDDDLGNDEFVEGSWELLDENGSHPDFFFEGDTCEIVQELLG